MVKIVGIQFKETKRVYYFNSLHYNFKVGDKVIVDTVRGLEIGTVLIPTTLKKKEDIEFELKDVVRKATDKDLANEKFKVATKAVDKAANKGVIKANTASRKKASLAKTLNTVK